MIDRLAQSTYNLFFVHDLAVSIGWETDVFPHLARALNQFLELATVDRPASQGK